MKKVIIALAAIALTTAAYAQGTVNFNNRVTGSGIDAKILLPDGTGAAAGYSGQIYAGVDANSLKAVTPTTTFRTGNAAGYVNGITVDVGLAAGSKAVVVVRAFNGATYESSLIRGSSAPVTIAALGGLGAPPSLPSDLIGLTGFTLAVIPEPSTIALAALGAAALLFRRRK